MEALMTPPMVWVVAAAIFCVGVLIGVAIPRSRQDGGRAKELEAKLQESRQELVEYRGQVTQHFVQTADLLHAMTANYRAVYEHLANGAQSLCNGQVRTLNAAALGERLLPEEAAEKMSAEPHNAHAPASDETVTGHNSSPAHDSVTMSTEPHSSLDPVLDEAVREQNSSTVQNPVLAPSDSQGKEQRDKR